MKKLLCLLLSAALAVSATSQTISIIPRPVSVKQPRILANFTIDPGTQVVLEGSHLDNSIDFFNDYLQQFYHFKLSVVKKASSKNVIRLNFERLDNKIPGAYALTVDGNGIYIAGDNEPGVFYGIQTLIQLLPVPDANAGAVVPSLPIPYVSIDDAPRFAYRGLHLDVSRHFFSVDYIKKYIDFIALHKMNYFHWHLTDDQGWRIEIKKYPRLTSVGAWRDGTIIGRYPGTGNDHLRYGGFYTQEQIKEVVAYAAKRYVTIIPEIEMPGHSMAALAAYPQLGTTPDSVVGVAQTWGINDKFNNVLNPSEYTFKFYQDVLDEVMPLFPSPYIHIGGDECSKRWWHESAFCQQLMKEKGIKDEHGLQSYFIQRMEKYVNRKGKKIIGWDEILEGGLAPNATVMSWRGEEGGIAAAQQHHDVIMTPQVPVYLNQSQSANEDSVTQGGYNPIEAVYAYEPVPAALTPEQGEYVLGAQANMWSEYLTSIPKLEYMLFPRLSALSEVLWSPKDSRNWDDFQTRLPLQFKRYQLWGANYSTAYFALKATVTPSPDGHGVLWKLETKQKDTHIHYNKTMTVDDPPNPPVFLSYSEPIQILKSGDYSAWAAGSDDVPQEVLHQVFDFSKTTGKTISLAAPASNKYPGDGPFTLVNGIVNAKGMARSNECLGFVGKDCEAVIDLGTDQTIQTVRAYVVDQPSSWVYFPGGLLLYTSEDGQNFAPVQGATLAKQANQISLSLPNSTTTRYLKIIVQNAGIIPAGNPGAGSAAWLFVSELQAD